MPSNYEEVNVEMPYGQIACKVWGTRQDESLNVIALHGFMDNCGSFDLLMPLLNENYFVVAVDFPGHGFSSHLPQGVPYTDSTWLLTIEYIATHFKFTKFNIIGHSLGACVAIDYASLFPERVMKIVSFDTILPTIFPLERVPIEMAKNYKYFFNIQQKKVMVTPSFEPDIAIKLMVSAHKINGELDAPSAKILMKRATKLAENNEKRLIFTRDERLNCSLSSLPFLSSLEPLKEYYKNLRCDLLIIRGETGKVHLNNRKVIEIMDVYKEHCKSFKIITTNGGHFSVLTHPEQAVSEINDFFNQSIN